MKRLFLVVIIINLLLFSGCEDISKLGNDDESKYEIEQIEFPFGEWDYSEGKFWDYYKDGLYNIYVGRRENESSPYKYEVYTYDCMSSNWEKQEFKWNDALVKEKITIKRNLQIDNNGREYVLASPMTSQDSNELIFKIYELKEDGTIERMDKKDILIKEKEKIRSFQICTSGKFLISTISEDNENESSFVDFINETRETVDLPENSTIGMFIDCLIITDDIYGFPYMMDENKSAVQFKKFNEKIPEKIITFDYNAEQDGNLYIWNMCKDEEENVYILTSQGLYILKDEEAEKVISKKEISKLFSEDNEINFVKKYEEEQFLVLMQNGSKLGLFKISN